MACVMVTTGPLIILSPSLVAESSFKYILLTLSAELFAYLLTMVGMMRIIALIVNGRSWVYGPKARAMGALLSGMIWAQMDIALILLIIHDGKLSLGIPTWFFLTLTELVTAYRAATDVRSRPIVPPPNS